MNLAFECRMVVFEWDGFGFESLRNDTSLSLHTNTHMLCCMDTAMLKWTRHVNTWQILKNTHDKCRTRFGYDTAPY